VAGRLYLHTLERKAVSGEMGTAIFANTAGKPRRRGREVYCPVIGYGEIANMIRNTTKLQKFGWVLFLVYLIALTYFTFFAESLGRTGNGQTYSYNLELFKEIKRFYTYRHQLGFEAVFLNLAGNVLAFMPFGFFLPVVSRRGRKWYNAFMLGFLLSFCIETVQLVFKVGSFDVDDLLLNTIGGVLGFLLYKRVQKIRIRRKLRARKKKH
jgi:glycopeptide antibiotics resistance protein